MKQTDLLQYETV